MRRFATACRLRCSWRLGRRLRRHGGRRRRREGGRRAGGEARQARAGRDHALGRLHEARARACSRTPSRVRGQEPRREGQGRRRHQRRQDHRREPRRQGARRRAVVLRGQLRRVLRLRRLARPRAVHGARRHQRRHLPGGAALLHAVRRHALRAADARRRLRPLLQRGHAGEGGARRPAEDDGRADRVREEAHRAERRRLAQGRRLQPRHGLVLEHALELRSDVRRQVGRRRRQVDARAPIPRGRSC